MDVHSASSASLEAFDDLISAAQTATRRRRHRGAKPREHKGAKERKGSKPTKAAEFDAPDADDSEFATSQRGRWGGGWGGRWGGGWGRPWGWGGGWGQPWGWGGGWGGGWGRPWGWGGGWAWGGTQTHRSRSP